MESREFPYQEEWRKYREGNSLGCLSILIVIPLILLLRHFSDQLPDYFDKILIVGFSLFAYLSLIFYKGGWKCPRCRQEFDYSKRIKPAEKCVHCSLPIYYGSSYFWDYWGTERGREQIQKVKDQENKLE